MRHWSWCEERSKEAVKPVFKEMEPVCTVDWVAGWKRWWVDGKLHRLDGPAVEWANDSKAWWVEGKRHRLDGPAVEWADGAKVWYVNGKRHRLDGPAVEWADGSKVWYVDGEEMTEEEFHTRVAARRVKSASKKQ